MSAFQCDKVALYKAEEGTTILTDFAEALKPSHTNLFELVEYLKDEATAIKNLEELRWKGNRDDTENSMVHATKVAYSFRKWSFEMTGGDNVAEIDESYMGCMSTEEAIGKIVKAEKPEDKKKEGSLALFFSYKTYHPNISKNSGNALETTWLWSFQYSFHPE
jgi:hypothetical protein